MSNPKSDSSPPWGDLGTTLGEALVTPPTVTAEKDAEYVSCIKIGGRPILPPVMNAERRAECRRWRSKAQEVEQRLRNRKREEMRVRQAALLNDSSDDESEEEEILIADRPSSTLVTLHSSSPTRQEQKLEELSGVSGSAFKNLIHKLRQTVPTSTLTSSNSPPVENSEYKDFYASALSVNTVIENKIVRDEMDLPDSPPATRRRSGSYTLTEPSPLLQAYMERYGDADMSLSSMMMGSPKQVLPSPAEITKDREKHLCNYLDELSSMPTKLSLLQEKKVHSETKEEAGKSKLPEDSEVLKENSPLPEVSTKKDQDDGYEFSIASSARDSVSIPMDTPREQLGSFPNMAKVIPEIAIPESDSETVEHRSVSEAVTTIATPWTKRDQPSENEIKISEPPSISFSNTEFQSKTNVETSRQIEEAVSSLAQKQNEKIQQLLEEQAKQREEMKKMFEQQQQQLITKIISTIHGSDSSPRSLIPSTIPPRPSSPLIPTVSVRADSTTLSSDFKLPDKVFEPGMHAKFCKLSALAKGYLTRRLLKTQKVQSIIQSMKDTMGMALQLHQEARAQKRPVSTQDIDLHRRLLQHLNKDCQTLHDIFFKLKTTERMSIISLDYQIRNQPKKKTERRISAVTKAKLEQKLLQSQIRETNSKMDSPKRRKMTKSASGRIDTGLVNRSPSAMTRGRQSAPIKLARRSLVYSVASSTTSTSAKSSSRNTKKSKSVMKKRKPWK